ncbi:hypothetical protein KW843_07450 [Acidovorax sp. sif1233]|uniref:hypothetical protein n=1 Tax=Acidovorax sp. sif1233 TaxID=2854792 RepID=UPI001C472603|nr:hypothetical protein [Acidovorax sp. sif1233]MBV7454301.1 hypothetical protein [Acidovorax sp. sif1233]
MATTPKKQDAADKGTDERTPMAVPVGGWPPDEFTGQAGSFERDPYTGVRRRVEEATQPALPRAQRNAAG